MADMFGDLQGMGLTPQEINKVAYHRQNLSNPFINQKGEPMTIYATGIVIPEGKNKGKYVSVPGYVGGRIVTDENQLYDIWKKDIQGGKWPIYDTAEKLNARDSWLHQIMDKDMTQYFEQQRLSQPYQQFESLNYQDPFLTIK